MSLGGNFYEFRKKYSVFEKTKEDYTRAVSGDDVNSYMENWSRQSGLLEFQPDVEFVCQKEADYAVITIQDPFATGLGRIPRAYKK